MPTSKKNWYYAAKLIWPVLANTAQKGSTITYEEVAPHIPTNPLSVGRALGPIQDYCLDNRLPPLTSIVVSKQKAIPGDGFVAWDTDDLQSAHAEVFGFNWNLVPNPFNAFGPTDTPDSFAEAILREPNASGQIYTKVKVRGVAQSIFRSALMSAYGKRCAMCGLTFLDALEAAHIIPWAEATSDQRLDPKNGLLLCALHHQLFDAGWMTISQDGKVVYFDPTMEHYECSTGDKQMVLSLHGRDAFLPQNKEYWPSSQNLAVHHKTHEFDL